MHCCRLSRRLWLCSFSISLLLCAAVVGAQETTAKEALPSALPDAPLPQGISTSASATPTAAPATTPTAMLPYAHFYWRTIPPEYRARPLTASGKMKFVLHEMISPVDLVPALVSAGWGVYFNTDPKYGPDDDAFGQRLAAAAARQTSFRLFSDGLLPIAFREDPRYYRLGHGSVWRRTGYALTRVFVGRTDSGAMTPNYSAIMGRAMGAALTPAYYPNVSRTAGVVWTTFGTAVAGEMGLDFLREFLPGTFF